jgi:putative endonuclease
MPSSRPWSKHCFVYILGSISGTLYTGVCSNLEDRVWQHKIKKFPGFTADYDVNRLLYYESHDNVHVAIAREKQVKRWRREKKVWLIESMNPQWVDLSSRWYDRGPSTRRQTAAARSG